MKTLKNYIHKIKEKLIIKTAYESNYIPYERILSISIVIFLSILIVIFKLTFVTIWPSNLNKKLKNQASRQIETEVSITSTRGTIYDRKGRVLAASLIKPSIFIVPRRIPKNQKDKKEISKSLNISLSTLEEIAKKKSGFHWIHRFMEMENLKNIGDLSNWRDFIGWAEESKRYYPEVKLASHILGFVGKEGNGLAGIEYSKNNILKVFQQKKKVMRDARGKITLINPGLALDPEPEPESLQLSIDVVVQSIAEKSLQDAVLKSGSVGGSITVAHIPSGQVLAMASYPRFHPSQGHNEGPEKLRFRAISDGLEVGSILKPFIISYALDKNLIGKKERFNCEKGRLNIPGGVIHDTQPKSWLTPEEILKFSSNICMYKISKKIGRQHLLQAFLESGLIGPSGIELSGEWQGGLSDFKTWKEMRFANLSFGQGIAVSNSQVTKAFVKMLSLGAVDKLTILKSNKNNNLKNINFKQTENLEYIKKALSHVTTVQGSGSLARVEDINVAGKTGTAQKYNPQSKGYTDRVSSFIGFAPYENPTIAVTVIVDSPKIRPAFGGLIAAPVFSRVVDETMKYLLSSSDLYVDNSQSIHGEKLK